MRFACLYIPGFTLQVHVRHAAHLQGTAFAVLSAAEVPRVVACSRLAREAGLRLGLTATQARAVAADVRLIDAAPAAYVAAMQALGEAALGLSVTVDIETPGVVLARVPPGKGAPWGDKLVAAAAAVGFQGRVGIADDRFAAWAATQREPRARVRVIPAGGSAAFLAPMGLELLPLDEDVRRMLMLLGVKTLGDFAALPPPSVGRRWAQGTVDAQAQARGDDRRPLKAYLPAAAVVESLELEAPLTELEPLTFVLRPLAERALARLSGRARAVARLLVRLTGEGRTTEVAIAPSQPTVSARTLVDLTRAHLAERKLEHPVAAVELVVAEEGDAVATALELFPREAESPDLAAVDVTVARLRAAFGGDAVGAVRLADRHRPEASFERVAFAPPPPVAAPKKRGKARKEAPRILPMLTYGNRGAALRLIEPPTSVEADGLIDGEDPPRPPSAVEVGGARHRVASARGPTRLEGEWWTDEPMARDYFEIETDDGGHYWMYRDHADGRFYLHGVFD